MFIEEIGNRYEGQNKIKKQHLVALFMALMFAAMIYPNPAHAQLVGSMEADIPFQFHAGDTKLPAGKYVIRMLDVYDAKTKQLLFRGTTSDTLSNNSNKNTENLDKGVEKMFKKFPPGSSK